MVLQPIITLSFLSCVAASTFVFVISFLYLIVLPLLTFSPSSVMANSSTSAAGRRKTSDNMFHNLLSPLCGGSSLKKVSDSPLRITVKNNFYADNHGMVEGANSTTIMSRYLAEKKSSLEHAASFRISLRRTLPKTIYLIRHAESNENRRLECLARSLQHLKKLAIPEKEDIVASVELLDVTAQLDSDVSDVGKRQIAQLARKLQRDNFIETHKIQVVAHSPLRRARQTSEGMLGCVSPRLIPEDQPLSNANNEYMDNPSFPFVMVSKVSDDTSADAVITESINSISTTSRPLIVGPPCVPITLRRSSTGTYYGPHGTLPPEEYNSPGKNTPLVSKIVELPCLMERTPMEWLNPAALDLRIEEFEEWLDSIEEERIAVVGHSQYFKTMLGLSYKFKNCDVWQLTYVPRRSINMKENEEYDEGKKSIIQNSLGGKSGSEPHIVQERMLRILSSGRGALDGSTVITSSTRQLNTISQSWSDSDSTINDQPEETWNLPRGWSGLKMLYRYNPDEDDIAEET